MAKWQPPIPAGALYSKAARAIGPALPLLAYCYDLVQRDGWLDLSLKDAAGDMDESYQTVKRWWWTLKDGPFFKTIEDHGRNGWRVRFKDIWLDWRILNAREENDPFSRSDEDTEVNLEEQKDNSASTEGQLKVISRSNEGPDLYPQNNVYGTHDSDQAIIGKALNAPRKEPEKRRNRDPNQQHPGCLLFFEKTGYRPNRQQAADIATAVTDLDLWANAVAAWLGKGNRITDANGMLDWYKYPARFAPKEHSNGLGSYQAQVGGMARRNGHRPANADLPLGPVSSGQAEYERQYREWLDSDDESDFIYKPLRL